jgi:hypothetical protein
LTSSWYQGGNGRPSIPVTTGLSRAMAGGSSPPAGFFWTVKRPSIEVAVFDAGGALPAVWPLADAAVSTLAEARAVVTEQQRHHAAVGVAAGWGL